MAVRRRRGGSSHKKHGASKTSTPSTTTNPKRNEALSDFRQKADDNDNVANANSRNATQWWYGRIPFLLTSALLAVTGGSYALYFRQRQQQHPMEDDSLMPPLEVRTFEADHHRVQVHVVKDFLPLDLATRWRATMAHEWELHKVNSSASSWLYATNDGGNTKTRSLANVAQRQAKVRQRYEQTHDFSYAKWELNPATSSLVQEIDAAFRSATIMDRIRTALRLGGETGELEFEPHLSDLFVTHYAAGDFLSSHNDGNSGTWAFVVSLMDSPIKNNNNNNHTSLGVWKPEFGGQLQYACPPSDTTTGRRWCETLEPEFNTAVFFRTRPQGPDHQVLPVTHLAEQELFHRFAFTGWYMDVTDDTTGSSFEAERNKMRDARE